MNGLLVGNPLNPSARVCVNDDDRAARLLRGNAKEHCIGRVCICAARILVIQRLRPIARGESEELSVRKVGRNELIQRFRKLSRVIDGVEPAGDREAHRAMQPVAQHRAWANDFGDQHPGEAKQQRRRT